MRGVPSPPLPLPGVLEMGKLRVLSLFAGIGGFDLGLERTGGFETVAFCEIEPYQRALLKQHWPNVGCYVDINTLAHGDLTVLDRTRIDVVTGGFPCQPFSTASRCRRVAQDLWPQMRQVIRLAAPSYVIAENVSEYAIQTAASDMRADGYRVAVRNISGAECGAPHGRSRWWAIAHPHAEGEFQRTLDAEVAKLPELCANLWTAQTYARALRVSDGLPHRVHRVEALGNAVFPQIPQVIGHAILSTRSTLKQEDAT